MKIIILAAGRGERLMPLTQNTPKPLIDMGNGNTLLEEQLMSIRESGVIDEVVLVVGYLAEQIEAKMRAYQDKGFQVSTLYNPFWRISNNLYSLWLARNCITTHDVMITNGDNIFSADVFTGLVEQGEGVWLSASHKSKFDADDMKIKLQEGLIACVSKKIPDGEASAESPGLAMIKGARARKLFLEQLEGTVRDDENTNRFWLEVFNRMWAKGMPTHPWFFDATGRWQEIDFHLDVKHVRELLTAKVARLNVGVEP